MNPQFLAVMVTNLEYTEEMFEGITYTHDYWIFLAPLIFNAIDIITGWIQATINNAWDSTKMRYGLMRKAGMFLIVAGAYSLEFAIMAVKQTHVATFASLIIIAMEVISIFENLDLAGVPIPGFIKAKLKKAREGMKDEKDKDNGKEE